MIQTPSQKVIPEKEEDKHSYLEKIYVCACAYISHTLSLKYSVNLNTQIFYLLLGDNAASIVFTENADKIINIRDRISLESKFLIDAHNSFVQNIKKLERLILKYALFNKSKNPLKQTTVYIYKKEILLCLQDIIKNLNTLNGHQKINPSKQITFFTQIHTVLNDTWYPCFGITKYKHLTKSEQIIIMRSYNYSMSLLKYVEKNQEIVNESCLSRISEIHTLLSENKSIIDTTVLTNNLSNHPTNQLKILSRNTSIIYSLLTSMTTRDNRSIINVNHKGLLYRYQQFIQDICSERVLD